MAWLDEDFSTGGGPAFDAAVAEAEEYLRSSDDVVAELIDRHGPCTLQPQKFYFPVMVETVISQQLSTKAARAIYNRLVGLVGRIYPRPADIIRIPDEDLRGIGFSRSKTLYIKNVAELFQSRRVSPGKLRRMSDEEVSGLLTEVKGIGDWSAHMFLIFALGRLDVFPVGDLGLRNALIRMYRLRKPTRVRLQKIGNCWAPYRTIGTWYLWKSYDNQ
jgi:DNA-3-methyladenine glycosylase II